MVRVYVLNVPEFRPLVEAARAMPEVRIKESEAYTRLEADGEMVFLRKAMHMKPAVWYGIFTGGLDGEIAEFGRESVRVIGTNR